MEPLVDLKKYQTLRFVSKRRNRAKKPYIYDVNSARRRKESE